jgi:hypothetical protein
MGLVRLSRLCLWTIGHTYCYINAIFQQIAVFQNWAQVIRLYYEYEVPNKQTA